VDGIQSGVGGVHWGVKCFGEGEKGQAGGNVKKRQRRVLESRRRLRGVGYS